VADLVAIDGKRIAYALSDGRRVSRNRDGWKTYCPLCNSRHRRRKPRATLSLTIRDGKILVYCHRCRVDPVAIIRELVSLDLLPNYFRNSSSTLALVDEVRAATVAVTWKGIAKTTDLKVLHQALLEFLKQSSKAVFAASARQVGEYARVDRATASRSLGRLVVAGWLEKVTPARGKSAATWRFRIPTDRADRDATIQHAGRAGDGLLQTDPCFSGVDRAGLSRSAPPFDHDLFRSGKGLGPTKGRIYRLLAVSTTAGEIAKTLGYKHTRNARHHLQELAKEGLVHRLNDGRYERTDIDLDAVAERHGVLGAQARQRARHCEERVHWKRWHSAFESWRQTGEIVDPETGEVLESQHIPDKRARMSAFRYRVLSIRLRRTEATHAPRLSWSARTPPSPNSNSRPKARD
jgi:DNA-binding MarR family transcriptional regulator